MSQKNETLFLLKISATKYQIFKLFFFFPEKGDPYANLEYKTISVQYLGTEIFAKKIGILDEMILIKTQIICFRAPTNFQNDQDTYSYNIYSVSLGY